MVHSRGPDRPPSNRLRLLVAIAIIGTFVVVQVIGAVLSGSLALFADAGHMLSDLVGLVVALVAAMIAARPPTDRQTYGFQRVEVFGALLNGLILLGVAGSVAFGAVNRIVLGLEGEAHEVQGVPMLVVAIAGLAANIAALLILRGGAKQSINVRGAYLEVLGDMVGSVAVIIAAVVIVLTGFDAADVIASLAIAVFIVPRAIILLRDVVRILSQSVPADTDVAEIRTHILSTPGVVAVHDVHVWAMTSGSSVFSAHVVVESSVFTEGRTRELLTELDRCLSGHFDVAHSTFQLEPAGHSNRNHSRHP